MKIAVVGSRGVLVDDETLLQYLSEGDEVVSGGAEGVDRCAAECAKKHGLCLVELLPCYERYGRAPPIVRNKELVDYADRVVVFWDGRSRGAHSVIRYAQKTGKDIEVILCDKS